MLSESMTSSLLDVADRMAQQTRHRGLDQDEQAINFNFTYSKNDNSNINNLTADIIGRGLSDIS